MDESYASVWELVADAIPDALAVTQGARELSYRELEDRAARLAGALAVRGVQPGAHVALYLFNCPEYIECLFACSKLRAVPVNVNFRYRADELAYLVDNADAEVLVYDRSLASTIAAARDRLPGVHTLVEVGEPYERLIEEHAPAPRVDRSGDDLLLWYTGGTTGLPKGVLWRQGTLLDFGLATTYTLQDEAPAATLAQLADDVRRWAAAGTSVGSVLTTPLIHATAVHQANSTLTAGGTITLLERGPIAGDAVCETIQSRRPRVLEVVGDTVVRRIVRALEAAEARGAGYGLSSLQRVHNSGAMVHAELKDALLRRGSMHFYDSLGATEAVGFGFALTSAAGSGTTARFTLGPNARLLADGDRDVVPGSTEPGVLAVCRSSGIGYYRDPERSARVFRQLDGERYAMPGDWATLAADGTLALLGRGSGCINSGGEKVWPEEVEVALKDHPGVLDAVVVGVPDDEWGEVVGAVVARVPTTLDTIGPTGDELTAWVGARLADYKRPRRVVFRDEVRRNAIGKVDYEWARAAFEGRVTN